MARRNISVLTVLTLPQTVKYKCFTEPDLTSFATFTELLMS